MKRIHILGRKNHGKTTLVTELVQELTSQGFRVGTIKHTHHQHELDTPGKDSYLHREAGAAVAGILSREMNAVFWPPEKCEEERTDARYERFAPMFADCDLVLVEGDTQTQGPKIEVWRAERETRPLAEVDSSILAVITDDDPAISTLVVRRSDLTSIAKKVLEILCVPAKNAF